MPLSQLKRILYVEDDLALAHLLKLRMERNGFEVETVGTAEAALEIVTPESFDLILVDYNLPGMDGLELLAELKKQPAFPPLIILTAGGDERVAVEALELGAADYAVKDVNQAYLDLLPEVMQSAFVKERLVRENDVVRRELQTAKEKAEAANQAKTDFLTTMSHEIRTPLNVVTGLASVLARTPLNEEQYRIVETLRTNADLLMRLVNDLLDISRIEDRHLALEAVAFDPVDIVRNIRLMFEEIMRNKGLDLVIAVDEAMPSLIGDRARIEQITMNLMSNAIKFTAEGEIGLTMRMHSAGEGERQLTIEVRDSGIGIESHKLDTIFEKFTQADASITRRFGGSGLGLAIARALVDAMQGEITVNSTPGAGAAFMVRLVLPVASDKQTDETGLPDVVDAPDAHGAERPVVLLVEDYEPNIMVATLLLEDMGYDVVSVDTGARALTAVESRDEPFHAVLMDVQMREMDGYETTRRLREIERHKGFAHRIIGVTAHALSGDRTRCLEAGMDDYLSKPIQPRLLAHKLAGIEKVVTTS
jgi:two-component system, sensor histidine kinase